MWETWVQGVLVTQLLLGRENAWKWCVLIKEFTLYYSVVAKRLKTTTWIIPGSEPFVCMHKSCVHLVIGKYL